MSLPSSFFIRPAVVRDAASISRIYNHFVQHSTSTFQWKPETSSQRRVLLRNRSLEHPVFVAEEEGAIVGWAALSAHSLKEGWKFTAEDSIYIAETAQKKGLGRLLLGRLIKSAEECGLHAIIARISADQAASLALHTKMGFKEVGRLPQVGRKFDQWLDVIIMQRMIDDQ
ncbi:MAG: GNAT family N-acetyltransferase [Puniceicoccales bacterium]|nr:GNAT family N-acetyltransferase [Puniceicoccales bacterium]